MAKTVELQIEKSRNLIEGLRKHIGGIGGGVTGDEITSMELMLKELESANAEVDRLREELTPKVKHMNEVLVRVKEAYVDKKGGAAMLITSWRAPDAEGLLSAGALGRLRHPRQAIMLRSPEMTKQGNLHINLQFPCFCFSDCYFVILAIQWKSSSRA